MSQFDNELVDYIKNKTKMVLDGLNKLWDDIGIVDERRNMKKQLFRQHIDGLYEEMVTELEETLDNLKEEVDMLEQETKQFANDLGMEYTIPNNLPLYKRKDKLEVLRESYKRKFDERMTEIKQLELREKKLCNVLGKTCRHLPHSPLPTSENIRQFQTYLDELSDLKFRNEETFLKIKSSIIDIIKELNIIPSLDFERKVVYGNDSEFQVTEENMKILEELHKSLKNKLEITRAKISELRETLYGLWVMLEESQDVRSAFLAEHPGNSVDTLKALKAEINRCQEKKKENIQRFVEKLRNELVTWWDKCQFPLEQRSEFIYFESDCYTEDLLSLHELQIEKVKSFYEKHKHIYDLVYKREDLWNKMRNLEIRKDDPNRYKNRGGELLREEKERKKISNQLPKVEEELLDLVTKYEKENDTPFLLNGLSISAIIQNTWDEYRENRHIVLSARKHARETSRVTPSKSRICTPVSVRHATTASSTTIKRKLGTPSASTSKKLKVCNEKILRTAPSKLTARASTVRRISLERKKRFERSRKRIPVESSVTSTISEYENFEKELNSNPKCRSSLFPEKLIKNTLKVPKIEITHHKPLQNLTNTPPRMQRTPSKMSLRSKSPNQTNKLTPAPGTLPILI